MPRDILNLPAPSADLRLSYGDDFHQFVDFRFPVRPAPLVVHFHGGFWRNRFDLLHGGHLCGALTGHGLTTANVEYRRGGDSGGGWPGTLEDARGALRLARGRVPGPAVVTGHSAGGHIALWLAAHEPELTAVVALAPVACLQMAWELNLGSGAVAEFLAGNPEEAPERYRAACPSLHPSSVPRVLIHGWADDIVPLAISQLYLDSRVSEPVTLIDIPGADHFDPIDPRSAVFPVVQQTIGKFLLRE